jgi:hypothetical protein
MPKPTPYIIIRSPLLVFTLLEGSTENNFGGEYVKEFESEWDVSLETVNLTGLTAPDPGAILHKKRVCET